MRSRRLERAFVCLLGTAKALRPHSRRQVGTLASLADNLAIGALLAAGGGIIDRVVTMKRRSRQGSSRRALS
jgi:hypothetical protein